MAERQVTTDGVTRPLPSPFLVIATENPIDLEGTFPLPEAQLDRFVLRTALGYPTESEEVSIVVSQRHGHPIDELEPVLSADELGVLQAAVENVYVDDLMLQWIVQLVRATREVDGVSIGASVRGSLMLERTARAWALLHGRDHVVPDDVEWLFLPVLGHRLMLTSAYVAETRALGRTELLEQVKVRALELAPPPAPLPLAALLLEEMIGMQKPALHRPPGQTLPVSGVQTPSMTAPPAAAQVWQGPLLHAVSQQIPFTQNPLMQSSGLWHWFGNGSAR